MAPETNPSVVKEGGASNYNLSRGGLARADVEFISDLEKSLKDPPAPVLPTQQYFPTAGRDIRVGQLSNRTLGSVPIFAAGRGLIPVGMLEAKRNAEYQASIQRFAMFGPGNNDIYDQYVELANPWAQDGFNSKLQTFLNDRLEELAKLHGGDYDNARLAQKHDTYTKNGIREFQNYARGYNYLFGEAQKVLQDAASGDPDTRVDQDTFDLALEFFQNHDKLDESNIEGLNKFINKFRSHTSVVAAVNMTMGGIGKHITSTVTERVDLGTDAVKVLEIIEKEGFYTDAEIDQMVADGLEAYPFIRNDPVAKALFKRKFKVGIDKTLKRSITAIRKDYASKASGYDYNFGLFHDAYGNARGTGMVGTTLDGQQEFNTQYAVLPSKSPINKTRAVVNVTSDQLVYLKDRRTGKLIKGQFNQSLAMIPQKIYKDPYDAFQVIGNLDASSLQATADPYTGQYKGLKKGLVVFNEIGGGSYDMAEVGGLYEIITPEQTVDGDLRNLYGSEGVNYMLMELDKMPVTGLRAKSPKVKQITRAEGRELVKSGHWKARGERLQDQLDELSEETGIHYEIIGKEAPQNITTSEFYYDGEWRSYEELQTMGATPEQLREYVGTSSIRESQ